MTINFTFVQPNDRPPTQRFRCVAYVKWATTTATTPLSNPLTCRSCSMTARNRSHNRKKKNRNSPRVEKAVFGYVNCSVLGGAQRNQQHQQQPTTRSCGSSRLDVGIQFRVRLCLLLLFSGVITIFLAVCTCGTVSKLIFTYTVRRLPSHISYGDEG